MSEFAWTRKKEIVVQSLAEGHTIEEAAKEATVSSRTISRWKQDIEFLKEIDRLTLMMGAATRAERIRIAKKAVREALKQTKITEKDLLDWLKYMQSETDGIKLGLADDLTEALASLFANGASLARSRPDGIEEADAKADRKAD